MSLLSRRAVDEWAKTAVVADEGAHAVAAWAAEAETLGPASSERRLLECLESLVASLGFYCTRRAGFSSALTPGGRTVTLLAFPWQRPANLLSRTALERAADAAAGWLVGFNGVHLAIGDARDGMPRRMSTFDVAELASRFESARMIAALVAAEAIDSSALDDAVRSSDLSSRELQRGLQKGVEDALSSLSHAVPFETTIALLFRMLFVLFAEARSLVPMWHAVYRDHYSLAALSRERSAGTWAALEAGRRLLHDGCRTGTLAVTGFNGRLFSPAGPRRWSRSARLDSALDDPAAKAIAALVEYRPARGGARRVNYAELDVEELGSIYERVLDLDPAATRSVRKETGSFYTPRCLTDFVVRRTLAPLIEGRTSGQILALRVLDPAMGSGAFLVAALRYLAGALEHALMAEGALPEGDVTSADRERLRRLVARRCLYGVDANPTAVMLARLSLWLASLAREKPLTFLDARLKCGNSVVGIDPRDAMRAPGRVTARLTALPLFDPDRADESLRSGAVEAAALGAMDEDSVHAVRAKEKRYEAAMRDPGGISQWKALCDAWCAWWFQRPSARPDVREFGALSDAVAAGSSALPARTIARRLDQARAIGARERFFHWPLEFPDVFAASSGGFDAVIGNPPWEMLRGGDDRTPLKRFARESGAYSLSPAGHLNLYQLFVERGLKLTKPGGRVGLIVPWSLMSDEGSLPLRRALLTTTAIDTLARFDNNALVFQAHRSLRFAVVTTTTGARQGSLVLAPVTRGVDTLTDQPDRGAVRPAIHVDLDGLERLSGPACRIPDVASARQLAVALRIARQNAPLGSRHGWGAAFGRELNLTDDRRWFSTSGMPVLEGKHLHPFRIDNETEHRIRDAAAEKLLPGRPFDRPRLAYRDVTAPTNRQTLIAAIVPAAVVTSHSLFCLRGSWSDAEQRTLCAILNSAVANFLMRLFVGSHVTTALIEWLPVPEKRRAVSALGGERLGDDWQAVVAHLYGVDPDELTAGLPTGPAQSVAI